MASIELRGIAHSYEPGKPAVQEIDVRFDDGGAYALLGPSGCGKTTLLDIISGLLTPSQGRVMFDGRDVTGATPQSRNIAQVFQFPVVYDTMTVFENLAFPLRNRGASVEDAAARVSEIASLLDLGGTLHERAAHLGAEAKQRVSLGRGLVREDVSAVLLDEPLTVIDPQTRWLLRRKLRQVHRALGITLVYVTHDQEEALTMADQVAVMDGGRVVQIGSPRELFESPARPFVGRFIGSPGMSFLPLEVTGGAVRVGGALVSLPERLRARVESVGGRCTLGIRPDFVELADTSAPDRIEVSIERVRELGSHRLISARLGEHALTFRLSEDRAVPEGVAYVRLRPEWIRLYAGDRLVD